MSYNVLLVEDEPYQQETMRKLLASYPEFQIVGIASTLDEARQLLNEIKPDLALLDVMVTSGTTFELLKDLKEIPFEIIFTTSYDHFAVQAFRLSAVDYLMKPVVKSELAAALEKFKERKESRINSDNINNLLANLRFNPGDENNKVALPTLTGFLYVAIKDIVRCEADNTYTTIFTKDHRKIVISKTLKDAELIFSDYKFFRVHHSHLINPSHIIEYVKGDGGIVKMDDGSEIEVSRRRRDEFLHLIRSK